MARQSDSAPEFVKFMGPVIAALMELGGSGRPDEVRSTIVRALGISEEEQAQRLPSGVQSRFENQVHWARFYLAKGGYIDSSRRGVWALTEKARSTGKVSTAQAREIYRVVAAESRESAASMTSSAHAVDEQVAPTQEGTSSRATIGRPWRRDCSTFPHPASSAFASDFSGNRDSRRSQ